jgi:hypothetical protein
MADENTFRMLALGDKLGRGNSRRGRGNDDIALRFRIQGREKLQL